MPSVTASTHQQSQLQMWRVQAGSCSQPTAPRPSENVGWNTSDQTLEPLWSDGPVLPETLSDLLIQESEGEADSDDDDIVTLDGSERDSEPESDLD